MAEPKSSFLGNLADKITGAGSRFVDGLVEKGRDSIREAEAQDRAATGQTVEQQRERQANTARNQRLKGGPTQ